MLTSFLNGLLLKGVYAASWSDSSGDKPAQIKDFEVIFEKIIQVAVGFAVLAAFIMLIIGGFKLLTSGGNPKATESARNTITIAIIGLVALAGIWLILRFIYLFTGVDVTKFEIVGP